MRKINFYAPGLKRYETSELSQKNAHSFMPVSITGSDCTLNCDHCNGELLKFMRPAKTPERLLQICQTLAKNGTKGILISGGCDSAGRVPLREFFDSMRMVKQTLGLNVIVHTGLVDREMAKGLKHADIDGALIDIIGSDRTIKDVYHLDATTLDYEQSLANLNACEIPVVPHIVIGLHYGKIIGEENALAIISRFKIKTLVLVILTPLLNTKMENVIPPPPEEVKDFFRKARNMLPDVQIILGCARPMGEYKEQVDKLAIDTALNGIAFPAEGIVSYARDNGLKPIFMESCCGFAPSAMSNEQ
ncbi:MAG TPA: radical SAM protein [Candidatus Brocadiia bacterium]|nr:radical SAM protein [Planctomycetota bacterium]MDO8092809.1 radical SAM protein [Candidatus Brocadiales bacterium]